VDTHDDTTLDHGALIADLYSTALTHRHSVVRETAMALHYDMIEARLADVLVARRYAELQALIARCRRADREHARARRRSEWRWVLGLLAVCMLVVAPVTAAIVAVLS